MNQMNIGFSTYDHWAPLHDLKELELEDRENHWFEDNELDLENLEAIWVVLGSYTSAPIPDLTIGSETEEYLFKIDLTGATPILEDEDGRILYIRKKGGEKDGLGYSTHGHWASLKELKEIEVEDRGNPWFDDTR